MNEVLPAGEGKCMTIIKVKDLTREFRTHKRWKGFLGALRTLFTQKKIITKALDNVSFEVERGEIIGYIGPNGAGKSTTVKSLTGILVPTSGTVEVAGLIPYKDRKKLARKIGVVFGQRSQLWWHLPLIESFQLLKAIYKVPENAYQDNLDLLSELLDLGELLNKPVRQLSLGQRMRGELAAGILHNPELLFLDEPTVGMDVLVKDHIREFILSLNRERNTTVILCSHDLIDVEKICSRMMIVDHGRIIYDGSIEKIKKLFGAKRTLIVDFQEEISSLDIPMTKLIKQDGRRTWLTFNRELISASDIIVKLSRKYPVRDIAIEETDIEEIVRGIYEHGIQNESIS